MSKKRAQSSLKRLRARWARLWLGEIERPVTELDRQLDEALARDDETPNPNEREEPR